MGSEARRGFESRDGHLASRPPRSTQRKGGGEGEGTPLLSCGRISFFSQIGEQMLTQFQLWIGPLLALPKLLTRIRDERQVRVVVTSPASAPPTGLAIEIYARNTILSPIFQVWNTCKLHFRF